MTIIRIEGDNIEDYELISENEFRIYTYFHESDCQTPSSSMLGRYCRMTTYYLEYDLKRLGKTLYGTDEPEYFLNGVIEDFHPKIINVDVAENTGYDPVTYQKKFDEKSKWADKMEKEYGMRIY